MDDGLLGWALLIRAGLPREKVARLWDSATMRPTRLAGKLVGGGATGAPIDMRPEELLLLRVAVDVLNGLGGAKLRDLLRVLDTRQFALVLELLAAIASWNETAQREFVERACAGAEGVTPTHR